MIVIDVLESQGVSVSSTGENGCYILECDDDGTIEQHTLQPRVRNRMLQYLKRRYDVPIHFFYQ